MFLKRSSLSNPPISALVCSFRFRETSEMSALKITMDVRAYRERPASPDNGRAPHGGAKPVVATNGKARGSATKGTAAALWDYLENLSRPPRTQTT